MERNRLMLRNSKKYKIDQIDATLITPDIVHSIGRYAYELTSFLDGLALSPNKYELSKESMDAFFEKIIDCQKSVISRGGTSIYDHEKRDIFSSLNRAFSVPKAKESEQADSPYEHTRFYEKVGSAFETAVRRGLYASMDDERSFFSNILVGMSPHAVTEKLLATNASRSLKASRGQKDIGKDERQQRREFEMHMALYAEIQKRALTDTTFQICEDFAATANAMVSKDAASFPKALELMFAITKGYVHNWDLARLSNGTIQRQALRFTELFANDAKSNYLLSLVARSEQVRISSGTASDWMNSSPAFFGFSSPVLIKDRYTLLNEQDGLIELLAAPASEFREITEILRERELAQPAYDRAIQEKATILKPYQGTDINEWPYDIVDLWSGLSPEEERFLRLEHKIRSFFFEDTGNNPYGLRSFPNIPRNDRKMVLNDVEISTGRNDLADNAETGIVARQIFFSEVIKNEVEKDFGVSLANLSVREYSYLFKLVQEYSNGDVKEMQDFSQKFGTNGLRTCLVIADDKELRGKVFEFAQSVSQEDAKKVFETYSKLVGSIDGVGDYLREQFGHKEDSATDAVVERLLARARGVLSEAYERKDSPEKIRELVESVRVDTQLFFDTFRILKSRNELRLEDIADLELKTEHPGSGEISDSDRARMIAIAEENYKSEPEGFRRMVVDGISKAFANAQSEFHVLRYKGSPVAFNRFDTLDTVGGDRKHLYFGSFNVDSNYGNGKMGEVMIEQTLLKKAQEAVIEADCTSHAPIAARYIETGFVGVSRAEVQGVHGLHIRLDSKENELYVAKKLSFEEFVARAKSGEDRDGVLYRTIDGISGFEPLSDGYVLTRYVQSERPGPFYAAFERHPQG